MALSTVAPIAMDPWEDSIGKHCTYIGVNDTTAGVNYAMAKTPMTDGNGRTLALDKDKRWLTQGANQMETVAIRHIEASVGQHTLGARLEADGNDNEEYKHWMEAGKKLQ